MKWLILYLLKGRHEKLLLNFHRSKYWADRYEQDNLWAKVLKCRKKIRRIEPDFLIDRD